MSKNFLSNLKKDLDEQMNLILNKEAMTDMVGNFDKEEAKLK